MKIKKTKKKTDYEGTQKEINDLMKIATYTRSEKLIERYAKNR